MIGTRWACAALLLLTIGAPALAQGPRDPNNTRGFEPSKLYAFSDLDAVNLFNGNLMIRLPIGQSYPVSSSLSYQFTLTYNSKIWDYAFLAYDPQNGSGEYQRQAVPTRDSNAGLGWSLSLGRLIPPMPETPTTNKTPWTYVAADGSQHVVGIEGDYKVPTTAYTDDGSYIRATHTGCTDTTSDGVDNPVCRTHILEFPNGHTHTFDHDGRLLEIEDRFNNWIRVSYGASASGSVEWTIRDGYTDGSGDHVHRTHSVEFEAGRADYFDLKVNPNFAHRVKKVSLAAFPKAGETQATARAVYTLEYFDAEISGGGCGAWLPDLPVTARVPLLTKIVLPDGTSYVPQYNTSDVNAACESGTIRQLTLPTLGTVQWKHGVYELSTTECTDFNATYAEPGRKTWSSDHVGVKERTFHAGQGTLPVTWKYSPHLVPGGDIGPIRCGERTYYDLPGPPQVFINTVTEPSGNMVRHYFSALNAEKRIGTYDGPNEARDYGLPFTRTESSGGYFLSTETLDAGGVVLRKSYARYEREIPVPGGPSWENRPVGERTVYVLDRRCGPAGNEECYQQSLQSDFDGYGNYRKSEVSSNFGPTRTSQTDYNVTATGAQRLILPHEPWILNVYTGQTVTEVASDDIAPSVVATETCVDASTGVVKGRRTLKDGVRSTTDVVVRYTYGDGRGNVTSEDWYGGDHAPLQSSDLCSTAAAGASEYQVLRTFRSGVLQRSRHRGMSYLDADYDVDLNTGFASASREFTGVTVGADGTEVLAPGLQTTFAYDRLARPTAIFPPRRMETTYEYRPATSTSGASVIVRQGPVEGTGSASSIEFDGLGRVRRKGELLPNTAAPSTGSWSYRYTTYDGAGRVFQETEQGYGPESALRTTYAYDAFGNVRSVTNADNSIVRSEYHGYGIREKTRTVSRKLPAAHAPVVTTELYDALGRLVQIEEKSGPTSPATPVGAAVRTQYSYDAADRLRLVRMIGNEAMQTRVFDYDGRGFLRWEMQPESGMSSYTYDSRGNMRTKSVGQAESPYDLELRYDPAGRLLELAGRNPMYDPSSPVPTQALRFRPVKTYDYAASNDTALEGRPTDHGRGKLRTATRYNYPTAGTTPEIIKIVENVYYFDGSGSATERHTEIWSNRFSALSFTKHRTVVFSQQEDAYGRPFSVNYPIGIGAALPDDFPGDASRAVRYHYQQGRLSRVYGVDGRPDYASSITYHNNGLRDSITHGNGMVDRQEADSSGMPRPRRLVTTPSATICTPPGITVQPVGRKLNGAPSVRLTVAAGGTGPLSFQWYDANGSLAIPGATNSYYDATKAGRYYVTVSNACKKVQSHLVTVTADSCVAPTVFAKRVINKDGSVALSATPSGVGAITCSWRRLPSGTPIDGGCNIVVPSSVGLDRIEVRATTDCDGLAATYVLEPQPQLHHVTSLAAALSADRSHVAVRWPAVQGVAQYVLTRYAAGGAVDSYLVSGTRYEDRSITAGAAYVYALAAGYTQTSSRVDVLSNADVASTLAFTPIIKGTTPVELRYFNELLDAVNSIRAVKGWPKLTWSTVMPPSVPVPSAGGLVYAFYLTSLRPRMDEVLHALGVPVVGYSNPDPKQVGITAEHMTEFQRRAQ